MANKDRKDREGSISSFVTASLDNMKRFIDRTSDEVVKADIVGANRRLADKLIDDTKETFEKVAESANKREPMAAVRFLAIGLLDGASDLVKVAAEESQRINLIDTGTKVTTEGLDMLKRQLDITFDVTAEVTETVGGAVDGAMDSMNSGIKDINENINSGISNIGNMMPNVLPFNMGAQTDTQKRPGVITRVEIEADKVNTGKETHAGGGGGGERHSKK